MRANGDGGEGHRADRDGKPSAGCVAAGGARPLALAFLGFLFVASAARAEIRFRRSI